MSVLLVVPADRAGCGLIGKTVAFYTMGLFYRYNLWLWADNQALDQIVGTQYFRRYSADTRAGYPKVFRLALDADEAEILAHRGFAG